MASAERQLGEAVVTKLQGVTWTDKAIADAAIRFSWDLNVKYEEMGDDPMALVTVESRGRAWSSRVTIEERPVVIVDLLWKPGVAITATLEDQLIQIANDVMDAIDQRSTRYAGFVLTGVENEPLLAIEQIKQLNLLRSTVNFTFLRDRNRS